MIKSLVLSVILSANCPPTKLIGFTSPLTAQETESLNHAKNRCKVYYKDAPCLKSFEKREENVFWALCGNEKE